VTTGSVLISVSRPWAGSELQLSYADGQPELSRIQLYTSRQLGHYQLYCSQLVTRGLTCPQSLPGSAIAGSWTSDLVINSPTHYNYTVHHQATLIQTINTQQQQQLLLLLLLLLLTAVNHTVGISAKSWIITVMMWFRTHLQYGLDCVFNVHCSQVHYN